MTFSIVAGDDEGAEWGVAVASKFLAVGAVVPAARAGVGALATQSFANLAYRPEGIALLAAGHDAKETLASLTAGDPQRESRQAGVVDRNGLAATFTGAECLPWAGGRTGHGYAIQGNILTGPEVVDAMERAWLERDRDTTLARQLVAALRAGDEAGGDSRGRQGAALLVVGEGAGYGGGSDVAVDLRVDDHPDPVPELLRLVDLHDLYFGRPDEAHALPLRGAVRDEVATLLRARGFTDPDVEKALSVWAGIENYEARLLPGRIDPLVLERLRAGADPADPAGPSAGR